MSETVTKIEEAARPVSRTLGELLGELAQKQPNRPAVMYHGTTISYAELNREAMRMAKSLHAIGVKRGDRVGVLLGNQPEWVIACFGAASIGAAFVPLNTWYKSQEIEWTIRHCGLSVLVSASAFLKADYVKMFNELIPELSSSEPGQLHAAAFPRLRALSFVGSPAAGALSWDALLDAGSSVADDRLRAAVSQVAPEDDAFILYTSGSTAEPKGVLLRHRGVIENGFDIGHRRLFTADDRVFLGSPLFYGLGATNALPAAVTHGAALVLQDHFDAGRAIQTIFSTQSTVWYGAGSMTRSILDHPDYERRKVSSLQKGNAGTVAEYKRMTLVEMGLTLATQAYGLTESYGHATGGEPDDPLEVKLHTNGRPLPGFEFTIVDPVSRQPLPQGETGLVILRGYTSGGYYANPAETAKAMLPEGTFDTGDLGSLDADGRMIFHSRLKEVVKSGGISVSPVEVEQLLVQHPAIADAHVVGVPHPIRGELVVAFVNAKDAVTEEQVKAFIRERVASFKVPHHVLFRTESQLPRLPSGKVAKYKLAEEALLELAG